MSASDTPWITDWLVSLPLIVVCVVIHVFGLALINELVVRRLQGLIDRHRSLLRFAVVIGIVALLATALHGLEVATWAIAYSYLDALPGTRSAMLYSLSAMTTYGHANWDLEPHWQMMGALEALCGMLLFGLTTAFLFATIQKVWPLGMKQSSHGRSA
jgi:hypothetical protein